MAKHSYDDLEVSDSKFHSPASSPHFSVRIIVLLGKALRTIEKLRPLNIPIVEPVGFLLSEANRIIKEFSPSQYPDILTCNHKIENFILNNELSLNTLSLPDNSIVTTQFSRIIQTFMKVYQHLEILRHENDTSTAHAPLPPLTRLVLRAITTYPKQLQFIIKSLNASDISNALPATVGIRPFLVYDNTHYDHAITQFKAQNVPIRLEFYYRLDAIRLKKFLVRPYTKLAFLRLLPYLYLSEGSDFFKKFEEEFAPSLGSSELQNYQFLTLVFQDLGYFAPENEIKNRRARLHQDTPRKNIVNLYHLFTTLYTYLDVFESELMKYPALVRAINELLSPKNLIPHDSLNGWIDQMVCDYPGNKVALLLQLGLADPSSPLSRAFSNEHIDKGLIDNEEERFRQLDVLISPFKPESHKATKPCVLFLTDEAFVRDHPQSKIKYSEYEQYFKLRGCNVWLKYLEHLQYFQDQKRLVAFIKSFDLVFIPEGNYQLDEERLCSIQSILSIAKDHGIPILGFGSQFPIFLQSLFYTKITSNHLERPKEHVLKLGKGSYLRAYLETRKLRTKDPSPTFSLTTETLPSTVSVEATEDDNILIVSSAKSTQQPFPQILLSQTPVEFTGKKGKATFNLIEERIKAAFEHAKQQASFKK